MPFHPALANLFVVAVIALIVFANPQLESNVGTSQTTAAILETPALLQISLAEATNKLSLDPYIELATEKDSTIMRIRSQLLFSEGSVELGRAGEHALRRLFKVSNTHPKSLQVLLIPRSNTDSENYSGRSAIKAYEMRLEALAQALPKWTNSAIDLNAAHLQSALPR